MLFYSKSILNELTAHVSNIIDKNPNSCCLNLKISKNQLNTTKAFLDISDLDTVLGILIQMTEELAQILEASKNPDTFLEKNFYDIYVSFKLIENIEAGLFEFEEQVKKISSKRAKSH